MKNLKEYTKEEVAEHCQEGDLWIISGGKVYDVSNFKHPGGLQALLNRGGQDVSPQIVNVKAHLKNVNKMIALMDEYRIGIVKK